MVVEVGRWVLFALLGPCLLSAQSLGRGNAKIQTCRSISLGQPGHGVPYRGELRNSDYELRLVVPRSLTAWGAGDDAPFHGFTIFLPKTGEKEACIAFRIYLHVDLGEGESRASNRDEPGRRIAVGNIEGSREEKVGSVQGVPFKNVLVKFSVARKTEVYDGYVWLVTPLAGAAKNTAVLDNFLSHICFEGIGRSCLH